MPTLERWFRLEVGGAVDSVPAWETDPAIFVMNHTAIVGLEIYLLYAALRRLRPGAPRPRTTVWPTFLKVPLLGDFYRASGCFAMSVEAATRALREGHSLVILPEGPDATDVRHELGPFHAGFLRVVRELAAERSVPVVPFGWAGVDEANPWWVTTNPTLVRLLMKPAVPHFDFALLPRLPLLRPSKVVLTAGQPLRWSAGELADEAALRAQVQRVRDEVKSLVATSKRLREERIAASPVERALHAATGARRVAWRRLSSIEPE